VTADADKILAADRVVFPGVGAIRDCMAEILRLGVDQVVAEVAATKPMLAICVGMQALMTRSEENHGVDCLGVFPGEVKFFGNPLVVNIGHKLKVPHMGWNPLPQPKAPPLWEWIQQDSRFYFVHSYYVHADDPSLIAATAGYGVDIHAALHRDNIFAVQCHPEKSSDMGLKLLSNFLKWSGQG